MTRRKELSPSDMNEAQLNCYQLLADVVGGRHHIYGKVYRCGINGIEAILHNMIGGWSTYDFDLLTRAVLLSHERAIRVSIEPCSPQCLRFNFHQRQRDGDISTSHPTIEQAIARHLARAGEKS